MLEVDFQAAYKKIVAAKNILVIGHINPDGDALASVNAFFEFTNSLGIRTKIYCQNKFDIIYHFLPHISQVESEFSGDLADFDVVVVLDCGALSRTGISDKILASKDKPIRPYFIEFDHHPQIDDWADLALRFPDRSSTSEIIYEFLKANHVPISKNMANCLLTGILTDTNNFFYPNTKTETVSVASELMDAGAQFNKISLALQSNKDVLTIKLWGRALENLRFQPKYRLAVSVLTAEDLQVVLRSSGHIQEAETGDFKDLLHSDLFGSIVGFLSNISEAKAVLLLRQESEGLVGGSWRTAKPEVDVSKLAKIFGGGGHRQAAGFKIKGELIRQNDGWRLE